MDFEKGDRVIINRHDVDDFKKAFNGLPARVKKCGSFASTIVTDSGVQLVILNRHLIKEES